MTGRARLFAVERPLQSPLPVLAIALASKCDAIVATVVAERSLRPAQEREALNFLSTAAVQDWIEAQSASE
jgi:hypothetical protein